jgi:8-oxo-dGTP pyrophosphatase MutT (NUDIX family)
MGGISVDEGFGLFGGGPRRTGSLTRVAVNSPDRPDRADPTALRQAATVMLVRDAAEPGSDGSSLEVLRVRRNLQSDFVGGAFVFPGGSVDPLDGGAEAEAACYGRSDAEASTLLGVESGGLAYWVAALRETFEEAGLLLADRPDGPPLLAGEPEEEARFVTERAAVNAGTRRFLDLCRDERLRLLVGQVHYFAHWIAPRGAPRRFDTRFFVAAAPRGQQAAHDAGETIADTWISPRRALEGHRDGVFELIFPTIRNLQAIGRFATSGELLEAAARASGSVPTIEPRVVADGSGVRILLPGDEGYDDDHTPGPPRGPADFTEAIRTISQAANQEGGPTEGGVAVPAASPRPEG